MCVCVKIGHDMLNTLLRNFALDAERILPTSLVFTPSRGTPPPVAMVTTLIRLLQIHHVTSCAASSNLLSFHRAPGGWLQDRSLAPPPLRCYSPKHGERGRGER